MFQARISMIRWKKCMDSDVKAVRPGGRPKETRSEVAQNDCQIWQLCKEDAMDCSKWRKLMKEIV